MSAGDMSDHTLSTPSPSEDNLLSRDVEGLTAGLAGVNLGSSTETDPSLSSSKEKEQVSAFASVALQINPELTSIELLNILRTIKGENNSLDSAPQKSPSTGYQEETASAYLRATFPSRFSSIFIFKECLKNLADHKSEIETLDSRYTNFETWHRQLKTYLRASAIPDFLTNKDWIQSVSEEHKESVFILQSRVRALLLRTLPAEIKKPLAIGYDVYTIYQMVLTIAKHNILNVMHDKIVRYKTLMDACTIVLHYSHVSLHKEIILHYMRQCHSLGIDIDLFLKKLPKESTASYCNILLSIFLSPFLGSFIDNTGQPERFKAENIAFPDNRTVLGFLAAKSDKDCEEAAIEWDDKLTKLIAEFNITVDEGSTFRGTQRSSAALFSTTPRTKGTGRHKSKKKSVPSSASHSVY